MIKSKRKLKGEKGKKGILKLFPSHQHVPINEALIASIATRQEKDRAEGEKAGFMQGSSP